MSWPSMVAALVVPLLCALVYVVWIPHGNAGRGAWFATKIWVLAYPLFFFGLIGLGGLVRRESRAVNWPSWRAVIFTGVLSGLGIVLVGWLMVLTPIGQIVRDNSPNLIEKAEGLGFATKERFLMVAIFITVLTQQWRSITGAGSSTGICARWLGTGRGTSSLPWPSPATTLFS